MHASRMRWALVVALVVGCGAPPSRPRQETGDTSGGDAARTDQRRTSVEQADQVAEAPATAGAVQFSEGEDAEATTPPPVMPEVLSVESTVTTGSGSDSDGGYAMPPNMGYGVAREPSLLALVGYTPAPGVPARVLVASLELPPGQRFVPPVSSCQDVLLYVSSGTLSASGTGIASVDSPTTLYAGDAVRFGPEGDGLVVNDGSEPVRTLVALARSEDGGPARIAVDERGDRVLCPSTGASDPLSRPQRVASFSTSAPLVVSEGALEVRILLDADASGAEHAGLAVLTGEPSFAVPEHVHDAAAEILYFESGSGTMHLGEHDVDVGPGITVYVPEGVAHSFEPRGTEPLRALQFYAPSGPEQRFRAMASGG